MAGVCEGQCLGHSRGDEQLTLKKCYSCGLPQLYVTLGSGRLSVSKSVTLERKGENFFSFILYFYFPSTIPPFLT